MADLDETITSEDTGHRDAHARLHRIHNRRRYPDFTLHDSAERTRIAPQFTKYTTTSPLFAQANNAGGSYWPWVIRVDRILATPLDTYYMYVSTDHAVGAGGVTLMTASSPTGPWTNRGQVYVDLVVGEETETPSVVWNEATSEFYMYYQQLGLGNLQSTALAKSPDGVTWTRYGKVIDTVDINDQPSNGHTGYFRPVRMGNQWYGFSLLGGGDERGASALWCSHDGVTWYMDPRRLGWASDVLATNKKLAWHHGNVVTWRGQWWLVASEVDFTGGSAGGTQKIVMFPLAHDLRSIIGKPYYVASQSQAWEEPRVGLPFAFVDDDGKLYVYYYSNFAVGLLVGE